MLERGLTILFRSATQDSPTTRTCKFREIVTIFFFAMHAAQSPTAAAKDIEGYIERVSCIEAKSPDEVLAGYFGANYTRLEASRTTFFNRALKFREREIWLNYAQPSTDVTGRFNRAYDPIERNGASFDADRIALRGGAATGDHDIALEILFISSGEAADSIYLILLLPQGEKKAQINLRAGKLKCLSEDE